MQANLNKLSLNPASYPDVSLSMKMCAQRKAGRRQRARRRFACRLYPSHGPLRFIASHSRFVLAFTMRKTKRLRRRLHSICYLRTSTALAPSCLAGLAWTKKKLTTVTPIWIMDKMLTRRYHCEKTIRVSVKRGVRAGLRFYVLFLRMLF